MKGPHLTDHLQKNKKNAADERRVKELIGREILGKKTNFQERTHMQVTVKHGKKGENENHYRYCFIICAVPTLTECKRCSEDERFLAYKRTFERSFVKRQWHRKV